MEGMFFFFFFFYVSFTALDTFPDNPYICRMECDKELNRPSSQYLNFANTVLAINIGFSQLEISESEEEPCSRGPFQFTRKQSLGFCFINGLKLLQNV